MKWTQQDKERIVQETLSTPGNASEVVCKKYGVSIFTLQKWRDELWRRRELSVQAAQLLQPYLQFGEQIQWSNVIDLMYFKQLPLHWTVLVVYVIYKLIYLGLGLHNFSFGRNDLLMVPVLGFAYVLGRKLANYFPVRYKLPCAATNTRIMVLLTGLRDYWRPVYDESGTGQRLLSWPYDDLEQILTTRNRDDLFEVRLIAQQGVVAVLRGSSALQNLVPIVPSRLKQGQSNHDC